MGALIWTLERKKTIDNSDPELWKYPETWVEGLEKDM